MSGWVIAAIAVCAGIDLMVIACCKVSGDCAREEERQEQIDRKEVDTDELEI